MSALRVSVASVALSIMLTGCSLLITDETCVSDTECPTDQRCAEEGFCIPIEVATCVDSSGCASGEVCNASGRCEALEDPGCERLGSEAEDALVLGFIMTFSGPYAESGIDQRRVVNLALEEINEKGGFLAEAGQRELAFLACDDKADKEQAKAAATYLVSMGVPAILGPGFSSLLQEVATEVTIPTGTFTLSPSSTAVSIRELDDEDLIWRISSSDTKQANTLAYFALWLALEKQNVTNEVRVVAVHTNDNYGAGFREGFEAALDAYSLAYASTLNDANITVNFSALPRVAEADSSPEEWEAEVERVLGELKDTEPDMMLFVGYEDVAGILAEVRQDEGLKTVPLLLTDGVASVTLATTYDDPSQLPEHIFGVQPGYRTGAAYEHFVQLYEDPVPPTWTEYTYDAVYLLAYAAASMSADTLNGQGFVEAFKRFDDPEAKRRVNVGPDHFITACQDMADGLSLNVRGASGDLDFDLNTGEPKSVGIMRWKVDFPKLNEPGEIVDCGLAMIHKADASVPMTYWCNATCSAPSSESPPCVDGSCEAELIGSEGEESEALICSQGRCTGSDDCRPELAP